MKRLLSVALSAVLICSLSACSGAASSAQASSSADAAVSSSEPVPEVEEEPTVELTFPQEIIGEATQDDLDRRAADSGFQSIKLNEDGSATYVMTKSKHQQMVENVRTTYLDALAEMVGAEQYPDITDIQVNDDFTQFTITTRSTELSLEERLVPLTLYDYGKYFGLLLGQSSDAIHVDFANAESGEILASVDSPDLP